MNILKQYCVKIYLHGNIIYTLFSSRISIMIVIIIVIVVIFMYNIYMPNHIYKYTLVLMMYTYS